MQSIGSNHALFPIVQGGMYADLRAECAAALVELDTPGYAIGGLSVGEPRELSQEMTSAAAPLLPREKPRYVMGVGMPDELPEYVSHGIDMMDCVLPSRNARNGYLFTSEGRVIIKHSEYKEDTRPVDPVCECYTCSRFSRAYLRHLFLAGEILYSTLSTIHNLRRYLDIMRQMREAIYPGRSLITVTPRFGVTARIRITFNVRFPVLSALTDAGHQPDPGLFAHDSDIRDLLLPPVSCRCRSRRSSSGRCSRAYRSGHVVQTTGGILGTIVSLNSEDDTLIIRVKPDNIKIQVARSAVAGLVSEK